VIPLLRLGTAVVVAIGVSSPPELMPAQGQLPELLDRYLTTVVRPSGAQRRQLLAGEPVTTLLDSDARVEVAVFGAIWVQAPARRYVEALQDIETFERGHGFRITRRISTPPRREDFADVRLPAEDVEDLADCRVGDCIVKLGQAAIDEIRSRVDFRRPRAKQDVEAVFRERLFQYVNGYLARGNAGLAVYRDASRPTFVATEFTTMIERMPALADGLPQIRRFLLEYPNVALADATDFLYWQEVDFGLRPTIRVSHVLVRDRPGEVVVASKMLYASHYFWTGLELRLLLADPARGPGFWFLTINRSRADGLSGFTGFFVRNQVRRQVEQGLRSGLASMKARIESGNR
jgi:hypothetical protein